MSDYHLLTGNKSADEFEVIFHIPIPDQMNRIGTVSIRTALKEDGSISKISTLPWIDPAESDQITNGEIFEKKETFRPDPLSTPTENRNKLDSKFKELNSLIVSYLRNRYAYWRFDRNVPL